MAGARAAGATLYVTLEPCCHQGKTPPCTGPCWPPACARVVVAQPDPFPAGRRRRMAELRAAGIEVELGLLEAEARRLNAPYLKLVADRPAVDHRQVGHDARRQDRHPHRPEPLDFQCPSRGEIVHALRGRVDAIMVGRETARARRSAADRPAAGPAHRAARGARYAGARLARKANWSARPARCPCWWPSGRRRPRPNGGGLRDAGCEVFVCAGETPRRAAGRAAGRIGPPADDQRAGRRRRPAAGQPAGRAGRSTRSTSSSPRSSWAARRPPRRWPARESPKSRRPCGSNRPQVRQLGDDIYITARCSADSSPGNREDREPCSTDR